MLALGMHSGFLIITLKEEIYWGFYEDMKYYQVRICNDHLVSRMFREEIRLNGENKLSN